MSEFNHKQEALSVQTQLAGSCMQFIPWVLPPPTSEMQCFALSNLFVMTKHTNYYKYLRLFKKTVLASVTLFFGKLSIFQKRMNASDQSIGIFILNLVSHNASLSHSDSSQVFFICRSSYFHEGYGPWQEVFHRWGKNSLGEIDWQ